jgi:hypothetical protein
MNRTFLTVIFVSLGLILIPNLRGYTSGSGTVAAEVHLKHDVYDPALFRQLQSFQDLVNYIDTSFKKRKNSPAFVHYIGKVISLRFYHGYSYYSQNDNWIAFLAGKFIWQDLSAIVIADDIMKHPSAACSQQSIILAECARYFGFDFRKIAFDHHYATEIRVGGDWLYIDPNLEVIPENQSLNSLLQSAQLFALYKDKLPENHLRIVLGHPRHGNINETPAFKAYLFQKISYLASEYFFCILFFIQVMIFYNYLQKDRLQYPAKGYGSFKNLLFV